MTIFIISQIIRIAETIVSSLTVTMSSTWRLIIEKVGGLMFVRRTSAMVNFFLQSFCTGDFFLGADYTASVKRSCGVVRVRWLGCDDLDLRPHRFRGDR